LAITSEVVKECNKIRPSVVIYLITRGCSQQSEQIIRELKKQAARLNTNRHKVALWLEKHTHTQFRWEGFPAKATLKFEMAQFTIRRLAVKLIK